MWIIVLQYVKENRSFEAEPRTNQVRQLSLYVSVYLSLVVSVAAISVALLARRQQHRKLRIPFHSVD